MRRIRPKRKRGTSDGNKIKFDWTFGLFSAKGMCGRQQLAMQASAVVHRYDGVRLAFYASSISREASYERCVVSLIDRQVGKKNIETDCCREEGNRAEQRRRRVRWQAAAVARQSGVGEKSPIGLAAKFPANDCSLH